VRRAGAACLTGGTRSKHWADLCAFSLRRFIENDEDVLWSLVEPRVDRIQNTCVGIRHYTGRRKGLQLQDLCCHGR
jgi:hypothetical protein